MPLPSGAEALGVVTAGSHRKGVLIRMRTGVYVMGNSGAVSPLPQDEVEKELEKDGAKRAPKSFGQNLLTKSRIQLWLVGQNADLYATEENASRQLNLRLFRYFYMCAEAWPSVARKLLPQEFHGIRTVMRHRDLEGDDVDIESAILSAPEQIFGNTIISSLVARVKEFSYAEKCALLEKIRAMEDGREWPTT